MAGRPGRRARLVAKALAAQSAGFESVRDGCWQNGAMDTIHLVDPRGGKKLYARRNAGSQQPIWFNSLREAKNGVADD